MSAFPDTPVSLLARLAATCTGESAAGWERFFDQYQPVIQKFATFAGAGRESEDVTQDVFVKLVDVFRNGRYDPKRGSFRAYVFEERPIDDVATAFGVTNNVVSQTKTRVERMIAEHEALLGEV